jgi:hypothetical protein
MKRIFQLLTAGLISAGLFAACTPPFEPDLSEQYNLQSEYSSADLGITVSNVSALNADLEVQPVDGSGYPRRITLQVNSSKTSDTSNFDIGTDKKIKGLSIFPLKAGADNYTLYEEVGSGLAYQAYAIAKNQVELQLPFNETELQPASSPTSYLILKLDPVQLSFNGGKGKLNTDGDAQPGEAEEDAFYLYYTNVKPAAGASYTAPTMGRRYANIPTDKVTYAATPDTNFLNYGGAVLKLGPFSVPAGVSATPNAHFTASTLIKAYRFEKFNRNTGTWAPLVPAAAADADFDTSTGELTIKFSAADAPAAFDIVRYMVNPYLIVADIKAGGDKGTTLRGSYDQSGNNSSAKTITDDEWAYTSVMDTNPASPYLTINGATVLNTTPSLAVIGDYRSYYLDLAVVVQNPSGTVNTDSTVLDLASLRQAASAGTAQTPATQSNIRIFQVNGTGNPNTDTGKLIREIAFDRSRIELKSPAEFRIHLPQDYVNYESNAYLEVHIINAKAAFQDNITSKTATFFKPNGAVDYTGSYRFRVKGPAS